MRDTQRGGKLRRRVFRRKEVLFQGRRVFFGHAHSSGDMRIISGKVLFLGKPSRSSHCARRESNLFRAMRAEVFSQTVPSPRLRTWAAMVALLAETWCMRKRNCRFRFETSIVSRSTMSRFVNPDSTSTCSPPEAVLSVPAVARTTVAPPPLAHPAQLFTGPLL